MFPCREGLSIASFWTCWSQSSHEPKYSPENDAKSSFTVPHTLFERAALCLCQFSSPGDSTAQASVQNPNSYRCVTDFHYAIRLAHCPLASTVLWGLPAFSTGLFNTKVGITNLVWFVSWYLEKDQSQKDIMGNIATEVAIGLLSSSYVLYICSHHTWVYIHCICMTIKYKP